MGLFTDVVGLLAKALKMFAIFYIVFGGFQVFTAWQEHNGSLRQDGVAKLIGGVLIFLLAEMIIPQINQFM